MIDTILDAVLDTLKSLPFLFLAFLIIELLEHRAADRVNSIFKSSGKAGPLIGSLLGCVPQCGFSVMSANLYLGGVISLGTLIAVFLSTSDEAVILLASNPEASGEIIKLLIIKVIIGIAVGYTVDLFIKKKSDSFEDICDHDKCHCHDRKGVLVPALIHTGKVFGFLLLFNIILGLAVALIGTERLSSLLLADSVFQPFLAALLGFIPNCASSVLLTELYLEGAVSFGSVVAGLSTSAGTGLLILFREKSRIKDNLKIIAILYISAVFFGALLQIFA